MTRVDSGKTQKIRVDRRIESSGTGVTRLLFAVSVDVFHKSID